MKRTKQGAVRHASAADTLFSTTQQRVLGRLFGQPDRSFYATELIMAAGGGSGAVQRELARLEAAGLIESTRIGNQKHYQANPASPVFTELNKLILRLGQTAAYGSTSLPPLKAAEPPAPAYAGKGHANAGPSRVLRRLGISRRRLASFCRQHRIKKLSFFGSVTRDDFGPASDVDVMVEFEPGSKPSLFTLSDLRDELSKLFGGRRVDVITSAPITNPMRRASIMRDLETVYAAR